MGLKVERSEPCIPVCFTTADSIVVYSNLADLRLLATCVSSISYAKYLVYSFDFSLEILQRLLLARRCGTTLSEKFNGPALPLVIFGILKSTSVSWPRYIGDNLASLQRLIPSPPGWRQVRLPSGASWGRWFIITSTTAHTTMHSSLPNDTPRKIPDQVKPPTSCHYATSDLATTDPPTTSASRRDIAA